MVLRQEQLVLVNSQMNNEEGCLRSGGVGEDLRVEEA